MDRVFSASSLVISLPVMLKQQVIVAMTHGGDGSVGAVKGVEGAGERVAHTIRRPATFDDLGAFLSGLVWFKFDQAGGRADGIEPFVQIFNGVIERARALLWRGQGQGEPFLERGDDFDVALLPVLGGLGAHMDFVGDVRRRQFRSLTFGTQAGQQADGDVAEQTGIGFERGFQQRLAVIVMQYAGGVVIIWPTGDGQSL